MGDVAYGKGYLQYLTDLPTVSLSKALPRDVGAVWVNKADPTYLRAYNQEFGCRA